MSRGLVIHAPSTANKLEPPGVQEVPHGGLHPFALLSPPPPEECRLNIDKASLLMYDHHNITTLRICSHYLVSQEGLDDTVYDVLDSRPLYVIPVTTLVSPCPMFICMFNVSPVSVVILVHSLEPAHVIVRVRDPVDIGHPGHRGGARVIATPSEAELGQLKNWSNQTFTIQTTLLF